ncbi:MAG: hypothetical protein ABMA64_01600 [Myxococcota bacterium]
MSVEVTYLFPFRRWQPARVRDVVRRLEGCSPPEWSVHADDGPEPAIRFTCAGASARVFLRDDDEGCASASIEAPHVDPSMFDAVGDALDQLATTLGGACEPQGDVLERIEREAARGEVRLDSFDAMRAWLRSEFELHEDDDELVSLVWSWTDTSRTHLVFAEIAEYLGREWLQLSARVAPADRVPAERLIALGGLANATVEDGVAWFVVTVPFGLDASTLTDLIDHLASHADNVEHEVLGTDEY